MAQDKPSEAVRMCRQFKKILLLILYDTVRSPKDINIRQENYVD